MLDGVEVVVRGVKGLVAGALCSTTSPKTLVKTIPVTVMIY